MGFSRGKGLKVLAHRLVRPAADHAFHEFSYWCTKYFLLSVGEPHTIRARNMRTSVTSLTVKRSTRIVVLNNPTLVSPGVHE